MYTALSDDACCEQIRLTVKHTFIEFQCLDMASPRLRRVSSDPSLPFVYFPAPEKAERKLSGTSTPTTCASQSVSGDDSEAEECPLSPHSSNGDSNSSTFGNWSATASWSNGPQPSSFFLSTSPSVAVPPGPVYRNECGMTAQRTYCVEDEVVLNTTLMVRNLPQDMTQNQFVEKLIDGGYRGLFDFVYMPMNLRASGNFGYVFINFKSHYIAAQVMARLGNHEEYDVLSALGWTTMWSTCQGFSTNVERYRNSPLMHELVPKDCKPSIYDEWGNVAAFPRPTKNIPKPRIHRPKDAVAN